MTYQGDYDPAGFDAADPLTWPPAAGYSPGDWWYLTGPGTVEGRAADVGWRMYPIGTGRRYGELDYGDAVFGGPTPQPPWPPDALRVRWWAAPWADAPAWDRPPPPTAGCPFGDTGWRMVVELFALDPTAQLYGSDTYGSGVYGDTIRVASDWVDVTRPVFGVVVTRGGTDAAPLVDVDEATVELFDADAELFPIEPVAPTVDGINRSPGVSAPLRVSLIDPSGDPHPVFTGRVETLVDVADRLPRDVVIDAYGMAADLVTSRPMYSRNAETAAARIADLVRSVNWSWGVDTYPPDLDDPLRRVELVDVAQVRAEVDRAALSAGVQVVTASTGVLTFREWPNHPDPAAAIAVADRLDTAALAIVAADVVADRGELLNAVTVASEEVQGAAEIVVERVDRPSTGRFGRSSQSLGFPVTGLSAQAAGLESLADSVLDRFGRIVNRVNRIEVDTLQDSRWLAVLVDLTGGRQLDVTLTKPTVRTYSTVVVGAQLNITPGRITGDIYLSTLTPTL